jgi:imidazolonepropionase-like amidohydrolase
MKLILRILLLTIVITAVAVYLFGFWPLHDPHPKPVETHGVLAIVGAKVYVSPDAQPLANATVVVRDGKIAAVGPAVAVPAGATLVPCNGCVVTAGFWNAHVHFTQSKWLGAQWKTARQLEPQLEDMLISRGFTTVVDTGSNLRDTIPIRRRIEKGELAGPKIYTAGAAQYPPNGIPYYLKDTLPRWLIALMPQPKTPEEAASDERRNISDGADILKLFTGSYIARGKVLPMPLDNARAAVAVAHAHGQLAFAHESDLDGVNVAINSGVDVLAHAVDSTDGVDDAVLQSIIDHHMSMIPTLKMFATTVTTNPRYIDPIHAQVRRFHALGGDLIFGTDVGYMTDYTTTGEFTALADSGLNGMDILRMLTVAPATRFGVAQQTGTVEVGKAGDLVVLDRDPARDVTAFSAVQTTIRNGKVIWQKR